MNNLIRAKLDARNCFTVPASLLWLDGTIKNFVFKIDTGCQKTCIPAQRLNINPVEARRLKEQAIRDNVPYVRGYGVSDTKAIMQRDLELINQGRAIECTALKFNHLLKNITIDGMNLGSMRLGVSYDREGNILLGMDILKEWDIHIGKSIKSNEKGQTIFLACPYDQLNNEYLKELYLTFGVVFNLTSAIILNNNKNT